MIQRLYIDNYKCFRNFDLQSKGLKSLLLLGSLEEPEDMKADAAFPGTFEEIGFALYEDCKNTQSLWSHTLLRHNQNELLRLREALGAILEAAWDLT